MNGKTLFAVALAAFWFCPCRPPARRMEPVPFPLCFQGVTGFSSPTRKETARFFSGKDTTPKSPPTERKWPSPSRRGKDGSGRQIGLYTIATTKSRNYKSVIPGENSYGPRWWSPDGTMIVFNHWDPDQSDWVLGLLTLTDGTFRVLLAPELKGVYSPFWSADSSSVYCHDLENFFRVSVETGRTAALEGFPRFSAKPCPPAPSDSPFPPTEPAGSSTAK